MVRLFRLALDEIAAGPPAGDELRRQGTDLALFNHGTRSRTGLVRCRAAAAAADARRNAVRSRRVVLAVLFLRYVVFEDPEISKRADEERRQRRKRARSRSLAGQTGHDRLGRGEMEGRRYASYKDKGKGKVRLVS